MDAAGQNRRHQSIPGFSHHRDHLLVRAAEPAAISVMQENCPSLFLMGWTISDLGYVCPNTLGLK
jgi:hypothetical protein